MKLDRDLALRAVLGLLLLGALAWMWRSTEWVEEIVPLPPRGEAARDGAFTAKRLVERLGGRAVSPEGLWTLPPARATLVLSSVQWDLFEGRSESLRRWVEGGGHLVIDGKNLLRDSVKQWLPVRYERAKAAQPSAPASAASAPQHQDPPAVARTRSRGSPEECHALRELDEFPATFGDRRGFVYCAYSGRRLVTRQKPVWALERPDGTEVVRLAVGQGRVTVLAGDFNFSTYPRADGFSNFGLAKQDNAPLFAALLDLRAGDEVWFVAHEDRAPFLAWLWQHGAPAIVAALAALALALWRGFSRFGPLMAEPSAMRRSMGEQIRGTAEFLWHRQPQALHAAQCRALHEAARRRLQGYDGFDATQRMLALARATGADARSLARALDGNLSRSRAAWADALAELENARRALLQSPSPTTSTRTR